MTPLPTIAFADTADAVSAGYKDNNTKPFLEFDFRCTYVKTIPWNGPGQPPAD